MADWMAHIVCATAGAAFGLLLLKCLYVLEEVRDAAREIRDDARVECERTQKGSR